MPRSANLTDSGRNIVCCRCDERVGMPDGGVKVPFRKAFHELNYCGDFKVYVETVVANIEGRSRDLPKKPVLNNLQLMEMTRVGLGKHDACVRHDWTDHSEIQPQFAPK